METPEWLQDTAARCRRLAAMCTDQEFREKLEALAADCDAKLSTARPLRAANDRD